MYAYDSGRDLPGDQQSGGESVYNGTGEQGCPGNGPSLTQDGESGEPRIGGRG